MLILVEGISDKSFIEAYLESLYSCKTTENAIEIIATNGKDNLKSFKSKINKNKTKIIFDADADIKGSMSNIVKQLKDMDNNFSSNCEIFLMPNNKDSGNLETLLENVAREKCILKCFDNYKECMQKLKDNNQNICLPAKKSKTYAYFHSFGFKNGIKDFKINGDMIDCESEYLQPLKNFLLDIKD